MKEKIKTEKGLMQKKYCVVKSFEKSDFNKIQEQLRNEW